MVQPKNPLEAELTKRALAPPQPALPQLKARLPKLPDPILRNHYGMNRRVNYKRFF